MAAVGDEEADFVVEHRAAVAVELGDFGQRAEHVDFRNGGGALLEALEVGDDLRAELGEKLGFEFLGTLLGT